MLTIYKYKEILIYTKLQKYIANKTTFKNILIDDYAFMNITGFSTVLIIADFMFFLKLS